MMGPLLQYQSLKTVLLHIDANTRFRISVHMPSMRDVEKVVPLKMSFLEISDNGTTFVNGTEYDVGVFRHFPNGVVSARVALEQNSIGVIADFDEFGFPFEAGRNVMLPGDVSFQLKSLPEVRMDTEEIEREYREQLRIHEEALKMQAELKSKGITVKDHLESLGPVPGNANEPAFENETRMRGALTVPPSLLSNLIEHDKLALLPFDCRRNNTKPPFTCYIQLTITNGESSQVQRFEYNKKLFEAFKYLNEALFGRRTVPIQVEHFELNNWQTIHRLPIGFRLHSKHVRTDEYSLAHASFLSLVENSERLESIRMTDGEKGDAFQTETVRRAKTLVIEDARNFETQRLTQTIRNLLNLEITIVDLSGTAEEIFNLIQVWLSADRPVGAFCCIELRGELIAENILTLVQTQYERAHRNNRCVTIQKTDFTRVEVFFVPFEVSRSYRQNVQCELKTRIVNV